jgi:hypothetical protein
MDRCCFVDESREQPVDKKIISTKNEQNKTRKFCGRILVILKTQARMLRHREREGSLWHQQLRVGSVVEATQQTLPTLYVFVNTFFRLLFR